METSRVASGRRVLDDTARTRNRSNPGGPGDGTAMHAEASAYPTSSSNNVTKTPAANDTQDIAGLAARLKPFSPTDSDVNSSALSLLLALASSSSQGNKSASNAPAASPTAALTGAALQTASTSSSAPAIVEPATSHTSQPPRSPSKPVRLRQFFRPSPPSPNEEPADNTNSGSLPFPSAHARNAKNKAKRSANNTKRSAQSMARLLSSHRNSTRHDSSLPAGQSPSAPTVQVPDRLLLRDIIYILQGIDGQFVRFRPAPPSDALRGPRRTFVRGQIVVNQDEEPQSAMDQYLQDGIEFVLGPVPASANDEQQQQRGEWSIPAPKRVLLHAIAELGWLYRIVAARVDPSVASDQVLDKGKGKGRGGFHETSSIDVGMVEQSLHAALKGELTQYFRLVAELESMLDDQDDTDDDGHEAEEQDLDDDSIENMRGGLTLRRLLVWTEEVKLRMRMMATLVEEAGGNIKGGALLTSLHSRTSNGDPFIRQISSRLLKTLSEPFFATLASWIYQGELKDPFDEFFVQLNPSSTTVDTSSYLGGGGAGGGGGNDLSGSGGNTSAAMMARAGSGSADEGEGRVQAHQLWEGKFSFRRDMLPGFLEESFGRKIFSTGKSLNFMKYSCQDAAWVAEQTRLEGSSRTLQYSDMVGLERSISLAYSVASQRLFDIFFDKFRLMDHLKALKDYLMLGKGDFVEILMESLGPSLDRPANLLYRHNLTATLETALRGSTSASDHPDTLRRLDARMLEFTQGEIGWDVFTLEYKVDAPLDTVLDPKSMEGYLSMFKHLWQIKRVEYALNGVQRRLMTGARTFLRVPELAYDFHHTRISLQQMIFFIRQLQYYCHLEVIGCSWQALEEFAFKKEGDLDSLIEAHKAFLERLVTKALLMNARKSSRKDNVSMLEQVRAIFRMMLQYRSAADSLCNYALAEASRQESARDLRRGIDSPMPPSRFDAGPNLEELAGIRDRLEEYSAEFRALAVTLVAQLGQAPDLDMRFLAVRLNFNMHFISPSSKGDS